jgi:hypothetical protein
VADGWWKCAVGRKAEIRSAKGNTEIISLSHRDQDTESFCLKRQNSRRRLFTGIKGIKGIKSKALLLGLKP